MRNVEHRVQQLAADDLDPDEDFDTSEGDVEANPQAVIEYGVELAPGQLRALERIAHEDGMSVGAVIRRMVDVGVQMDALQHASRHLEERRSDDQARRPSAVRRLQSMIRSLRDKL